MIDVGALRIAILREYKNMTVFCEASGVPRATMDNIMKGKSEPTRSTIQSVCDALHQATPEEKFCIFFASKLA